MPRPRAPWWMCIVAAVYVLTFLFNARQEALGPSSAGAEVAWPDFTVTRVAPGSPADNAGLQAKDVLEAVNGNVLAGMPDWFIARAHFERDRPVELQVRRGEQHLRLHLVITRSGWRTWRPDHYLAVLGFYLARFIVLLSAIIVAFRRPKHLGACLAALMLAAMAVAEGYPAAGWAAGLHHLPSWLAAPVCLATESWLLGPIAWFTFCAIFPRPSLTRRWRCGLALIPLILFVIPLVTSEIAMIYSPVALMKPWPTVLSATPVRVAQDLAGVAPLLYLNQWPLYQPLEQTHLLELWLAVTVVYLLAGFAMLVANYRCLDDLNEKRRIRSLLFALVLLVVVALHNFLTRNWVNWFGTATPWIFSGATFAVEAVLFLLVPFTLVRAVLCERTNSQTHITEAQR